MGCCQSSNIDLDHELDIVPAIDVRLARPSIDGGMAPNGHAGIVRRPEAAIMRRVRMSID
jgi:hypothetical protein